VFDRLTGCRSRGLTNAECRMCEKHCGRLAFWHKPHWKYTKCVARILGSFDNIAAMFLQTIASPIYYWYMFEHISIMVQAVSLSQKVWFLLHDNMNENQSTTKKMSFCPSYFFLKIGPKVFSQFFSLNIWCLQVFSFDFSACFVSYALCRTYVLSHCCHTIRLYIIVCKIRGSAFWNIPTNFPLPSIF